MLKGKRFFVIEDDPNNLAIVSSILRRQGAGVHFDLWGKATAERILSLLPVDMILLDLMLPQNVSGFDVYHELREYDELKDIPIVAVTAKDPATDMARARELGFSGYICKPIRTRTFTLYMESILSGTPVWVDLE